MYALSFQNYLPFAGDIVYAVVMIAAALLVAAAINHSLKKLSGKFRLAALKSGYLRLAVRYGLVGIAVLASLNRFGFDTSAIVGLASALFGLVAIGFVAVWSILSNFLCTVIILAFKPFRLGDYVTVPGENVSGTVAEISLTFTVLRADDGGLVHVPNNIFFQKVFIRRGR